MKTLEIHRRLKKIQQELREIRKEVLARESKSATNSRQALSQWKSLANRVTKKWNGASAVEEIRNQRKKSW